MMFIESNQYWDYYYYWRTFDVNTNTVLNNHNINDDDADIEYRYMNTTKEKGLMLIHQYLRRFVQI